MVVKIKRVFKDRISLLVIIITLFTLGCNQKHVFKETSSKNIKFLNKNKFNSTIACLINMPNYSRLEERFKIEKRTGIEVCVVGESLYGLANHEKGYYLKGEELELIIDPYLGKNEKSDTLVISQLLNVDSINTQYPGLFCNFKKNKEGYEIDLRIPWKDINIRDVKSGMVIPFDLMIADNDKDYIQKTKISLFSKLGKKNFGKLKLIGSLNNISESSKYVYAVNSKTSKKDTTLLSRMKPYKLKKIFYGKVKDVFDLSAGTKFTWDKENLYLFVSVKDNYISPDPKSWGGGNVFLDYGWIEDSHGKKVWEMDILYSKWAGGACKNQYIDTLLNLEPGTYIVKYITDESHAYGQWDDMPPLTPFYGIKVFK